MSRAKKQLERRDLLAEAREARAHRARGLGTVMVATGLGLLPVIWLLWSTLVEFGGLESGDSWSIRTVLNGLMTSVVLMVSGLLVVRGRRLRAKGAEYALASDERPPIVYLRPFDSDRAPVVPSFRSRIRVRLNLLRLKSHAGIRLMSYEEELAALLGDVAPFVTIGDPTERLPRLGAARLYAGDDEWRQTVDDLLDRGGAVILHVGDSPGLAWEVERIVGLGAPERVILSLPLQGNRNEGSREQRYADVRSRFGDAFPRGLPQRAGDTQFLYFDADWTPRRLEERGAVPSEPAPGSPGEQRTLVLRKLAPAFKLMWAPLWARVSVYSALIVPAIALVMLWGGGGADDRVAACEDNGVARLRALDAAERPVFARTDAGARRFAEAACRELDAQHHLDDRGTFADTAQARLQVCSIFERAVLVSADWGTAAPSRGWLTELAARYCKQIRADSKHGAIRLSEADSQNLFRSIGEQMIAEGRTP